MRHDYLKSMSLYAVSIFLMKGISLITLPLMAHFLSPAQLGHLEYISITTVFFSLLVGLAMHENLYRFIGTIENSSQQKQQAARLYSATCLMSLFFGSLIYIGYSISPWQIKEINSTIATLITIVLIYEAPLAIALAWLRLQNEAKLFFQVCICTVAMQVVLLIVALTQFPSVEVLFAFNVICTLGQFVYLHFKIGFTLSLPPFASYKRFIKYSTPIMLSGMVAFGLSGAERWLIAGTTDLSTLGIYAIAAKFALAVGIMLQPFHMWWMPKRFHAYESQGRHYTTKIVQYGVLLLCVIAVTATWMSQIFILTILPNEYALAAQYVGLTIAMMLFKELVELTNFGILYSQKTSRLLIINIVSTLIALCVFYLTIGSGLVAILLALIVGQVCRFIATLIQSQSLTPLAYQHTGMLALIVLTTLFLVTSRFQSQLEVSLLMLIMQPLLLCALAVRFELLERKQIKATWMSLQNLVNKTS